MLRTLVLVVVLAYVHGLPAPSKDMRSVADKQLLWDDILVPEGYSLKSGVVGDRYRWPNRELIYVMDPAFSAEEANIVYQAMTEISSRTCIRFRQRSSEGDYVYIRRGAPDSGCNSYVGRIGGQQVLNLQAPQPGQGHCIFVGTAAHELIHAIGFYHEQSRTDRDDWVTINWANIFPEYQFAFDKYTPAQVDPFGVPYDYASIMHYEAYAFAINTDVPTIYPNVAGSQLGGSELTAFDVQKNKQHVSVLRVKYSIMLVSMLYYYCCAKAR